VDPLRFVRDNTTIEAPPLVPEIRLHLATELTAIWQATEESLAQAQVPPPFWAFAWAGGQALARYLLDRPQLVAGMSLLDFGAGSGLVAIAAKKAGAARVVAAETDRVGAAAIALNAVLNGVSIDVMTADPIDRAAGTYAIVAAGDVCYERDMAERAVAWLRRLARAGAHVLLGDPGRDYLPRHGLRGRARYLVPTSREIEDRDSREAEVFEILP
jgi:predicted nicotinamide N-methyase